MLDIGLLILKVAKSITQEACPHGDDLHARSGRVRYLVVPGKRTQEVWMPRDSMVRWPPFSWSRGSGRSLVGRSVGGMALPVTWVEASARSTRLGVFIVQ